MKTVINRLYSLHPEHLLKLNELAKAKKTSKSDVIRQLIDKSYKEALESDAVQDILYAGE